MSPTVAGRPLPPHHSDLSALKPIFFAPADWLFAAARLPGKSLHVGVLIWQLSNFHKTRRILLPNSTAALIGLDRGAKYRALSALEEAGLIAAHRTIGQAPLVTILDLTGEPDVNA